MSHNPNNKDCPPDGTFVCTCQPAVDEVEQIRQWFALHDDRITNGSQIEADPAEAFGYVDTLLRTVDQLRVEITALESISKDRAELFLQADRELAASNGKVEELSALWVSRTDDWEEVTAELASAQSELERVMAERDALMEIARNSNGVAGWHMNGAVATWEELGIER